MSNRVGPKGQLVIEKAIRDALGIEPGWRAYQRVVGGHLEIAFRAPAAGKSLKGSLAPSAEVAAEVSGLTWEEIRERAANAAAWEQVGAWRDDDVSDEEAEAS